MTGCRGGLDLEVVEVGVVVDLDGGDGLEGGLAGGGAGGQNLVAGLEARDRDGPAVREQDIGAGGEAAAAGVRVGCFLPDAFEDRGPVHMGYALVYLLRDRRGVIFGGDEQAPDDGEGVASDVLGRAGVHVYAGDPGLVVSGDGAPGCPAPSAA